MREGVEPEPLKERNRSGAQGRLRHTDADHRSQQPVEFIANSGNP